MNFFRFVLTCISEQQVVYVKRAFRGKNFYFFIYQSAVSLDEKYHFKLGSSMTLDNFGLQMGELPSKLGLS